MIKDEIKNIIEDDQKSAFVAANSGEAAQKALILQDSNGDGTGGFSKMLKPLQGQERDQWLAAMGVKEESCIKKPREDFSQEQLKRIDKLLSRGKTDFQGPKSLSQITRPTQASAHWRTGP